MIKVTRDERPQDRLMINIHTGEVRQFELNPVMIDVYLARDIIDNLRRASYSIDRSVKEMAVKNASQYSLRKYYRNLACHYRKTADRVTVLRRQALKDSHK